MFERIASNDPLTKAIRVVLVFALVFWCSFRVECLAFGTVLIDDGSGHEDGTLEDAVVWNFTDVGGKSIEGTRLVTVSEAASGKVPLVTLSTRDVAHDYLVEPVWSDSAKDGDSFMAKFFDWKVDGSAISLNTSGDGAATVTPAAVGTATLSCALKSKYADLVSPGFAEAHKGKAFGASLKFDVVGPRATSLRVFDADGAERASGDSIALTEEQRASYKFSASVGVVDGVTGEDIGEYSSGLPDATAGNVTDPEWDVRGDEAVGASIDPDGTLHMSNAGSAVVVCTITSGGAPVTFELTVTSEDSADDGGESGENSDGSENSENSDGSEGGENSGASEGGDEEGGSSSSASSDKPGESSKLEAVDQGEDHAQPQLHVVVNNASAQKADGAEGQGAEGESGAAEGESNVTGQEAEGDTPSQSPDQQGASSEAAEKPLGGTYTVDRLRELAVGSPQYYSLCLGEGNWYTVKGTGPYLDVLLNDAGIENLDQIDSLVFEGEAGSVTMKWADVKAARYYYPNAPAGSFDGAQQVSPMVAIDSCLLPRVSAGGGQENGEENGEENEGENGGSGGAENEGGTDSEGAEGAEGGEGAGPDEGASEGSGASAEAEEGAQDEQAELGPQAEGDEGSGAEDSVQPTSGETTDAAEAAVESTAEPDMVQNTRFRILLGASSDSADSVDPNSLRWVNTIRVNLIPTHEEEEDPDTKLKVIVDYTPMPKGATATLHARPNSEIGFDSFEIYWQYRPSDDAEWEDVKNNKGERLMAPELGVPTNDETIGRQYRACMVADDPDTGKEIEIHSKPPVTIAEGFGFVVQLSYNPPKPGEIAIFVASVSGIPASEVEGYDWEMSTDDGATPKPMDDLAMTNAAKHTSQLQVPLASSGGGSGDDSSGGKPDAKPTQTLIRVKARATGGREAYSNWVLLTTRSDSGDEDGTGSKPESEDSNEKPDGSSESAAPSSADASGKTPPISEDPDIDPDIDPDTDPDKTGDTKEGGSGNDKEKPATPAASKKPTRVHLTTGDATVDPTSLGEDEIVVRIDSDVTDKVLQEEAKGREETEATTPGARWTKINMVSPYSQDVQRIIADNPFAPFAMPLGLGLIAAGGLEKLLAFRRQL